MNYTIETIADFCQGQALISFPGSVVSKIIIDHRDLDKQNALFVAIKGSRFDGHQFIAELIEKGVHHFLVSDAAIAQKHGKMANFIVVDHVVSALQNIAAAHRQKANLALMAITGSNGKTVVKEWLNVLLEDQFKICRSPKSYNSQIGVALSLLQIENHHTLGLFEAGISKPSEMQNLEKMLEPNIGLFTNIGDAHSTHFSNEQQKFFEKWQLFQRCDQVICCKDQHWFEWLDEAQKRRCYAWSRNDENAAVFLRLVDIQKSETTLYINHGGQESSFSIPFTDKASIENAMHCITATVALKKWSAAMALKMAKLSPVAMRMEVKQGIEQSVLIDDSYNSDLGSLQAALEHLSAQVDRQKMVILSDFSENMPAPELYKKISDLLRESQVLEMVAIGTEIERYKDIFDPIDVKCFPDIDAFWRQLDRKSLQGKAILIKGSRKFKLEQLAKKLQAQQHETVLEINLQQLAENLQYFKSKVRPSTQIMVMVKAFAYGSGGVEVAQFLERQRVDYLAVAYADEGISLRNNGVRMPIMVMSPEQNTYESMLQYELEPEIFSLSSLRYFIRAAKSYRHFFESFPIHIKLDTGMHRLGFGTDDLDTAMELLKDAPFIFVKSIFTHLSASDDASADWFTHQQVATFKVLSDKIEQILGYRTIKHCLNSTGIVRFSDYHFDMVRLGIGLYGFTGSEHGKYVHALGTLKTYIAQIKIVQGGKFVGYSLKGKAEHDRKIATIAIGYADGLDRRLGNGNWSVNWQGVNCPIVGNVCMDMCMIDVTETQAQEGDEVIVFEGGKDILRMAKVLETIPYEILTKVSQRVRRVFLQE